MQEQDTGWLELAWGECHRGVVDKAFAKGQRESPSWVHQHGRATGRAD